MADNSAFVPGDAILALDRAHEAARDANGSGLRRAMEEARDLLRISHPSAADRLSQALDDLDDGALVELDALLEAVRRDLAQQVDGQPSS